MSLHRRRTERRAISDFRFPISDFRFPICDLLSRAGASRMTSFDRKWKMRNEK